MTGRASKSAVPASIQSRLRALLDRADITPYRCAKDIGVSPAQLYELLDGKHGMSALLALKLERYFGVSAEALMLDQLRYDLAGLADERDDTLKKIQPVAGGRRIQVRG